ncbi:MAG TPA: hypothetical protein VKT82_32920 [Ktedonobacterales bacterium]|nr:hypothetical protein [Ktedonobacterales bacterium]
MGCRSSRLATVNSHKTRILSLCRNAWNVPTDAPHLTYHFLREKCRRYDADALAP